MLFSVFAIGASVICDCVEAAGAGFRVVVREFSFCACPAKAVKACGGNVVSLMATVTSVRHFYVTLWGLKSVFSIERLNCESSAVP
jgi:hypothetical protein